MAIDSKQGDEWGAGDVSVAFHEEERQVVLMVEKASGGRVIQRLDPADAMKVGLGLVEAAGRWDEPS